MSAEGGREWGRGGSGAAQLRPSLCGRVARVLGRAGVGRTRSWCTRTGADVGLLCGCAVYMCAWCVCVCAVSSSRKTSSLQVWCVCVCARARACAENCCATPTRYVVIEAPSSAHRGRFRPPRVCLLSPCAPGCRGMRLHRQPCHQHARGKVPRVQVCQPRLPRQMRFKQERERQHASQVRVAKH